jgi:cation:H+ antiporter
MACVHCSHDPETLSSFFWRPGHHTHRIMFQIVALLLLSGTAVITAGILLGRSADEIGGITGVGEIWTGWVLLAAATSLPEFVTDVSAVRLHSVNLGAGDLFGSSLTNMAILAVIVLIPLAPSDAESADSTSFWGAWLAITLTLLGTVFTLVHPRMGFLRIRAESLTLMLIWIVGTRILYRQQTRGAPTHSESKSGRCTAITRAAFYRASAVFVVGSVIIFLAAPQFAGSAKRFALVTGLGDSFVGTWLLGFSTALPEFVTSLTVCRLGAFDLAIANLYGSCAFNMVVFFAMDLASPNPVFSSLDPILALSGFMAVALMVLGLGAVAYRQHHSSAPTVSGGLLLASYGCAIWILYACR